MAIADLIHALVQIRNPLTVVAFFGIANSSRVSRIAVQTCILGYSFCDSNRHVIAEKPADGALFQLECRFPVQAGSSYYVQVAQKDSTSGAYKLTVK